MIFTGWWRLLEERIWSWSFQEGQEGQESRQENHQEENKEAQCFWAARARQHIWVGDSPWLSWLLFQPSYWHWLSSGWHGGQSSDRGRGNYHFLRLRALAKTENSTGNPESKLFTPLSSFGSSLSFEATAAREPATNSDQRRWIVILRLTIYSSTTKTSKRGPSKFKLFLSTGGSHSSAT